jgi:photosystem II PsbY protein
MVSGQAQAATELAQLAADNRIGTIALLFIPALGWVAFNIVPPLFNQLNRMGELAEDAKGSTPKPKGKKKRGFATAVGLGAALSLAAAQQADAATELSQLAASDNRCGSCLDANHSNVQPSIRGPVLGFSSKQHRKRQC